MINVNEGRCCDNCAHFEWYNDRCKKYNVEVDARSVCSDFVFDEKEYIKLKERENKE